MTTLPLENRGGVVAFFVVWMCERGDIIELGMAVRSNLWREERGLARLLKYVLGCVFMSENSV